MDSTIPAPAVAAPAPGAPPLMSPPAAKGAVSALFGALLDHSPDSLRRLGAAMAAVALPFLNAACQSKLGFSAPDNQILMAEGVLGAYIAQSAAKAMHAQWLDSKMPAGGQ